MGRVRLVGRWAAMAMAVAAVLAPARASRAVEAFDGRFQLHGFYENQTRVIARNFSGADDWDLTQWYQVLNLEMELDIAPDGFGPFDLISAYARVEARYDCVWTRACRIFPNVDTYGDRARHLPKRLSDSRRAGFTGSQFTGDVRKRHGIPFNRLGIEFGVPLDSLGNPFDAPRIFNDRETLKIWNVPGIDTLFGVKGPDGIEGSSDDPAAFVLSEFLDFEFASRKVRGNQGGVGTQTLGPWLPKNFVDPIGALSNKPNPFSTLDWGQRLARHHPGFVCRLATPGETPTIDLFGDRDRAPLAIDRLRDLGYRPRFDLFQWPAAVAILLTMIYHALVAGAALLRPRRLQQGIAAGRRLAQPGADRKNQVRIPDPLGQGRIHADADITHILRQPIVEMALGPEGRTDRQVECPGKAFKVGNGFRVPVTAGDDGQRSLSRQQHLA